MLRFDQFYTKIDAAKDCYNLLLPVVHKLTGVPIEELYFIEPSAGDGVFYNLLPEKQRIGIDIDPKCEGLLEGDFLRWNYKPPIKRRHVVIVGNPPFGKRGKMAVNFINKSFTIADTVAFIVPIIFKKYFIHKQIQSDARLVFTKSLDKFSFRTDNKSDYPVNTEFQVWTRLHGYMNKRLFMAPPTSHPDFIMHQYNNTIDALKIFEKPFDFAVPCQGWQDYTRREINADDCEKNKQWILFKAKSAKISYRLMVEFDFGQLSQKYTTAIPGFRKGDVVHEYRNRYDKKD